MPLMVGVGGLGVGLRIQITSQSMELLGGRACQRVWQGTTQDWWSAAGVFLLSPHSSQSVNMRPLLLLLCLLLPVLSLQQPQIISKQWYHVERSASGEMRLQPGRGGLAEGFVDVRLPFRLRLALPGPRLLLLSLRIRNPLFRIAVYEISLLGLATVT